MIYKIVQGNSFKLHILVRKLDLSKEFQRLIDFDMSQASNINVELACSFGESVTVPSHISGVLGNVLICDIPSTLDVGNYDIKVYWNMDGCNMVSIERNLLRIVEHNSQTNIPIGIVEGETTGMFDLRYYIVTDNISMCPVTYSLNNVSLSEEPSVVKNGNKLELTLTPSEGFNIGLVKVIMNGNDITNEVYADGKVIIPAVSGYVLIMANGDDNVCYYGASSAKDMGELDMEDLTKAEGDLVGKTITIETTDDKPYIWFISRVPVEFYQAGFEATMHTTTFGNLYHYWSDELATGNDNVYNIKLKE